MVSSLPTDKHPDMTPRRPVLRKLLQALTRTDADFDAFCIDYFSQVHARFAQGMDRPSKVNLLLELTEPTDVLKRLCEQYRHDQAALEVINRHMSERETEAAQRAWELREELERLYIEREQRRLIGKDTASLDANIVAVKRLQRQSPQLQEGEVLADRYRLLEVIGKGGFARVWQAFDRESCRLVAVKVLHRESGDDARRLERFLRGAREMKELEHPNIVRVLDDPAEYNGFHYFVMDYLPGGDLFQAISNGVIVQAAALKTILSVGSALEYAHRSHLIHRDVKPHNILLDGCGGARLTDFDLVWAADTTGGTRTGFLGTHIYVAPEQAENAKFVDARADIYSLGMTTLFVLHGKSLPQRALYQRALFIDELPCDEPLKALLRQATAIDPDDRPVSISAFCRELSHALVGNPPWQPATQDSTITQLTESNAVSVAKPLPPSTPVVLSKVASPLEPFRKRVSKGASQPGRLRRWATMPALRVILLSIGIGGLGAAGILGGRWSMEPPSPVKVRVASKPPTRTVHWSLASEPRGAEVIRAANGESLGRTPWQADVPINTGQVTLRLSLPGYRDRDVLLDTNKDDRNEVMLETVMPSKFLRVVHGEKLSSLPLLTINVQPAAMIYIDGVKTQTTPLKDYPLSVGQHSIILKNDSLGKSEILSIDAQLGKPIPPIMRVWNAAASSILPQKAKELSKKPGDAMILVRNGWKKLDDGEPAAAEALFSRAVELDPRSAEAVEGLGEAKFEQGNFDAAARNLDSAAKLAPKKVAIQELLVQALYKTSRFKECADASRKLLKQFPGSVKAKQTLESAEKKLVGVSGP